MIFSLAFASSCGLPVRAPLTVLASEPVFEAADGPVLVLGFWAMSLSEGVGPAGFRCRTLGVGKLFFLSMASTVRWKRRKRAWARRRVEGRSMVLESSLTRRSEYYCRKFLSGTGGFYIPYFNTSSKCLRCSIITSLCFSKIARAMKRWKLLLSQSVHNASQRRRISDHSNSRLYQTSNMRKKKKKLVESADCRWR